MQVARELVQTITARLTGLAKENAVVSTPITVDGRYVVPICRIGLGYGGGGGGGEQIGESGSVDDSAGSGMGGGGGVGVKPVAVLVVDGDEVRMESLLD
jgi:uncharacterized spore protein YtfJ